MKQPKPWYRKAKNTWYVEINGEQHFLGRHPADAPLPQKSKKTKQWNPPKQILDAFHLLITQTPDEQETPAITVAAICDRFLGHSQKHNEPATYAWYKDYLQDFCNFKYEVVILGR